MIEAETGRIDWSTSTFKGISTCYSFDSRHILYGKLRPYLNKVALPMIEGRCSTEIIPLLPKSDVCREYIAYFLRRKETVDYIMPENSGSRMPRADMEHLLNINIPLPPLVEQRRIAAEIERQLAAVDRAKTAAEEQLAFARKLNAAFLREVFEENEWETVKLGDLCKRIYSGGTPSTHVKEYYQGTIPWVTSKDMKSDIIIDSQMHISQSAIKESSSKLVPPHSMLMVVRSGILKHILPVAVNTIEVAINQDLKAFIPNETVDAYYLMYVVKAYSHKLLSTVRATTADNIQLERITDLAIPLPPIEEQRRVVEKIERQSEKTNRILAVAQSQLDNINAMPAAILRQAFSGQI